MIAVTDLVAAIPLPDGVQERRLGEVGDGHRVGKPLHRLRVHCLQIPPLDPDKRPPNNTSKPHATNINHKSKC